MHRPKALVYSMSRYFKPVKHETIQVNPSHDTTCLKSHHRPQRDQSTAWYNLNMEGYKHTLFKTKLISMFYSWKHNRIQLYSRIGIRGEGTNIAKDDKPIRLNRNLIHRMISSKTTQKPASTAWYPVLSRFTQDLTSLNPQHVTT
jgi:hypothetical protein